MPSRHSSPNAAALAAGRERRLRAPRARRARGWLLLLLALGTAGACRAPADGSSRSAAALATRVHPDGSRSYGLPRPLVAQALERVAQSLGWHIDERATPGLGPWRLRARGQAEQRFVGLVGARWKRLERTASLTLDADGRTQVQLCFTQELFGSDPSPAAHRAEGAPGPRGETAAEPVPLRRQPLPARAEKEQLFVELERELRRLAIAAARAPARASGGAR